MGKMPIPPNFYFAKLRLISDKAFIKSEPLFVKSEPLSVFSFAVCPKCRNFAQTLNASKVMFIVILFIFLGIALGYILRTRLASKVGVISALNGRFTTWLIWLLLFMLGLEVGSNRELIAALPTLGVEAMVLSVSATLGSCVLAWALWKSMKGGEKR